LNQTTLKTLLARQAIFNKKGAVWAYELLYRSGDSLVSDVNNLNQASGDAATSSIITQLFSNLDMNSIIGKKQAFINFTYNHIIQQIPALLPKNRVVIEVLETVVVDDALIEGLKKLSSLGYKIALDDFLYREEIAPLISLADIIKIDVLNLNRIQIEEQITPLRTMFSGKLLAEKIEDHSQFDVCMELGFDYFQGFFLNKPDPFKGKIITENKTHLLRLLGEINNTKATIKEVENIILQIPKLSYRILRLTNSVAFYNGKKIDSLMDAIMQLGLVQIHNWIILLLLASLDDIEPDLLERTLIRAKMCESLAKITGHCNPNQAYTVGILSTLDAILNEPMNSLLAKIELSEVLNEALLHHVGGIGTILKFAIDYEEANFKQLQYSGINNDDLVRSYLDGIAYANSVLSMIQS
jgi:EAL and modified HD-GYP domain-containing signal transduction protein